MKPSFNSLDLIIIISFSCLEPVILVGMMEALDGQPLPINSADL